MKHRFASAALISAMVFFFCNHGQILKDSLAYVGPALISQQDVELFDILVSYLPEKNDTFAITTGDPAFAIIYTEALYQKAYWNVETIKIRFGRNWKWKKRNVLSQMFGDEILQRNCGYSDAEVRNYYDTHIDSFAPVSIPDSTGEISSSRVIPPFDSVRWKVAEALFLSNYKPDSLSLNLLNPRVFRLFRESTYQEYFFNKFYQEKYGKRPTDLLRDLYGEGKSVDSVDISTVLSWLSYDQRKAFKDDIPRLVTRLARWKLFSEKAAITGYSKTPLVKKMMKWAWKLEVAQNYADNHFASSVRKNVCIDSTMALFSYRDESGNRHGIIDSTQWRIYLNGLAFQRIKEKFDSLVYQIRREKGVRYLHPEIWADGRVHDPAKLLVTADSARDAGNMAQAKSSYTVLIDYYSFTSEGKKALVELAKIQVEQQDQQAAIKNYQRFLISTGDANAKPSIMFQIGFLYDQFLDCDEMAEPYYVWVLKHAAKSKLADDAEFLLSHLGEPIPSVEQLETEALRQGKQGMNSEQKNSSEKSGKEQ